jgi:pumilio RNA-binding family
MQQLDDGDSVQRLTLLLWFHKESRRLSLSKSGCRLIQKALEVTGGSDRDLIIAELKDHVCELYASPNGNYVLSRAIEVLPASKIGWVISAILGQGLVVAKHKFGCRVICRLIEHCAGANEEQIASLLDEILADAPTLARHTYGNFVMQTVFEHTSSIRRKAILQKLLPEFSGLAMHRTGSLVAQRALTYCDAEDQDHALLAFLSAEGETSLTEVACSHYGAFVIEQVSGLRHSRYAQEIKQVLANNLHRLATSQHSQGTTQQVAIAFGLATSDHLQQIAQIAQIACQ